jgi:hypothetical protein
MDINKQIDSLRLVPSSGRCVKGRDVDSGNFRAWGLEFGPLMNWVQKDSLFQEA